MRDVNITECFNRIVSVFPDKEAVTDLEASYTWRQIKILTDYAAERIKNRGIGVGTHVAIWVNNSINWIVIYLALHQIGAVPILLNVAYKWRELEDAFENCSVEYIFYSAEYRDSDHVRTIRELNRDRLKSFKKGFLVPDEPVKLTRQMYCESSMKCDSSPNSVCSILFTSGTTRAAKGVMLTHRNIVNNSDAIIQRLKWNESDRICFAVPMHHCFGVTVGLLGAIQTGASIHIVRNFKTKNVFETVEKYKCTVFNGVPTMFLAMKNSSSYVKYDLSCLKGGLMAGSMILPSEYMEICERFKLESLNTAYGQTESSPAITVSSNDDSKYIRSVSAGKVLPEIEIRIIKDNNILDCMQEGEIQTRGYHVMAGYYNLPDETTDVISEDGWLSTGDLGYIDNDGYLHVTGRIKDIIVRGGENISPAEIEQVISQLSEVEGVKIVGIPAPIIQEELAACIIWKDDKRQSHEYIREYVRSQLSDYKVPKYILEFKEFPMNSNGKILRNELAEISRKIIEQE